MSIKIQIKNIGETLNLVKTIHLRQIKVCRLLNCQNVDLNGSKLDKTRLVNIQP